MALAACSDHASAVVLDTFRDPLPPHPLLPASGQRVLFVGPLCDGEACPPGTIVTSGPWLDNVLQTDGLSVVSPRRGVQLETVGRTPGHARVFIDPSSGVLHLDHTLGDETQLFVDLFGGPGDAWIFDGQEMERFEVEVADLSPGATLRIHVGAFFQVTPGGGAVFTQVFREVTAPGIVTFPRSEFLVAPQHWSQIYYMLLTVQLLGTAPASCTIAEWRIVEAAIPSERATWGALKALYR